MFKIESLENLVQLLNQLPGIGPKTAQRLSYHILRSGEYSSQLRDALRGVEERVHLCPQCFSYTDLPESCSLCQDLQRTDESICVVESPANVVGIESTGIFRGRYHVLHGVISPLEGIGPQDLRIQELLDRVHLHPGVVKEIIFALDADLEGDTTVLYLTKRFAETEIKMTRIAHGVPIGSDIDYVDHRTLSRALAHRVQL